MSVECAECERDLRGGHAFSCSRNPARKAFEKHAFQHGHRDFLFKDGAYVVEDTQKLWKAFCAGIVYESNFHD